MVWAGISTVKPKDSAYGNHKSCWVLSLYGHNQKHSDSNYSIHCLQLIMQMTRVKKKAPFTYGLILSINIKYSCVTHTNWHSAISQLSISAIVSHFSLFIATEEKRLSFHNTHSRHTMGFYVLLTVHPGTTLAKWPTWCTIALYKTFIIVILYMFRATPCSSSGSRIVLIRHLVLYSYYTRCCISTIRPPDEEHRVARNM